MYFFYRDTLDSWVNWLADLCKNNPVTAALIIALFVGKIILKILIVFCCAYCCAKKTIEHKDDIENALEYSIL